MEMFLSGGLACGNETGMLVPWGFEGEDMHRANLIVSNCLGIPSRRNLSLEEFYANNLDSIGGRFKNLIKYFI